MLVKKYYDGAQIHRIVCEEVKDNDTIMKILKRFADEPSAQPMRKKGRWIDTGSMEEWWAKEFKCSECGESMLGTANYCPNCGADMR